MHVCWQNSENKLQEHFSVMYLKMSSVVGLLVSQLFLNLSFHDWLMASSFACCTQWQDCFVTYFSQELIHNAIVTSAETTCFFC